MELFNYTFGPTSRMMKRKQKSIGWLFLFLFIAISTSSFFAPSAVPIDHDTTKIAEFSEDKSADFNRGSFRSVSEFQDEDRTLDGILASFSLQVFHSNSYIVQLTQAKELFNCRPGRIDLYLLNSTLTI